jgi:hypothetical protein
MSLIEVEKAEETQEEKDATEAELENTLPI